MNTVGLRLSCEGAKDQHSEKNEKSADLKHHTGRAALTDTALRRLGLPSCKCCAVNQSPVPRDEPHVCLIAWELVNGEFKTA